MTAIKEYACAKHGRFEAEGPRCPNCEREFRTAPAVHSSGTTKRIDAFQRAEMAKRGLTSAPKQAPTPSIDVERAPRDRTWSGWGNPARMGLKPATGDDLTPHAPAHLVN